MIEVKLNVVLSIYCRPFQTIYIYKAIYLFFHLTGAWEAVTSIHARVILRHFIVYSLRSDAVAASP